MKNQSSNGYSRSILKNKDIYTFKKKLYVLFNQTDTKDYENLKETLLRKVRDTKVNSSIRIGESNHGCCIQNPFPTEK